MMRIFGAGGPGTMGIPLVRALAGAGHQVTALTRTPAKQASLRTLGASAAVADALDRDAKTQVARGVAHRDAAAVREQHISA